MARLRMLTVRQFANSVRELGLDDTSIPALTTSSISAASASPNDALVQEIETLALKLAQAAVANTAWVQQNVTCDLSALACRQTTLQSLGTKAFRRPIAADEMTDYLDGFDTISSNLKSNTRALELVLAAFLQSPSFLYRVELDDGSDRYDNDAIASRIAFLVTDGPPDAELRAAAAAGTLIDPDVRSAHARRLLNGTTGRRGLRRFFEDWLQLDKVRSLDKTATVFPLFSKALGEAMVEQAGRTLEQLATSDADMRTMFDDTGAEVNAALAPLYDVTVPAASGWVRLTSDKIGPRPGVIGFPAVLALHAKPTKTSVTERGVFLRKDILCGGVPNPPDVFPPLPTPMPGEKLTTRQLFERHRSVEPCRSCHLYFDPMGITLETFDGIGKARTTENGLPIDPSGDLDGAPVADALQLAKAIKDRPDSAACMVQKLLAYSSGKVIELSDGPLVESMTEQFKSGQYRWQNLLIHHIASTEFVSTRRAP
jgi:hypothetical protein